MQALVGAAQESADGIEALDVLRVEVVCAAVDIVLAAGGNVDEVGVAEVGRCLDLGGEARGDCAVLHCVEQGADGCEFAEESAESLHRICV